MNGDDCAYWYQIFLTCSGNFLPQAFLLHCVLDGGVSARERKNDQIGILLFVAFICGCLHEESMWRMTLEPQEGMDFPSGHHPVRRGEPDCAYYMRTGVCGFGNSCRFNHPPNRRPVPAVARGQGEYPERLGQPECQYYLKTGTCKFGATCKFHHPRDRVGFVGGTQLNTLNLPLRPGERDCAYYMRTCTCKFGVSCRFNHPEPAAVGTLVSMPGSSLFPGAGPSGSIPAPQPYPIGLPAWPIARAPYLSGPGIQGPSNFTPMFLPSPRSAVSMPGWTTFQGQIASPDRVQQPIRASYIYGAAPPQDPSLQATFSPYMAGSSTLGVRSSQYPERPGQPECLYYMKTGECKFGDRCRFHHPRERGFPSTPYALNSMGLPLRPEAPPCTFYSRHGFCKFGSTCKFDHPLNLSISAVPEMPSAQYSGRSFPITHTSAPYRTDLSTDPPSASGEQVRHRQSVSLEEGKSSSMITQTEQDVSMRSSSSAASLSSESTGP